MGFYEGIQKNKKEAAIQCIRLLGNRNLEDVSYDASRDLYLHTNTRGTTRCIQVCANYHEYEQMQKKHPDARLMRCIGFYVLYWTEK